MFLLGVMITVADFHSNAPDKWDDIAAIVIIAIPCVMLNVLANVADRRVSKAVVMESGLHHVARVARA